MHKFKFTPDDLFVNRLKTYPEYNVFIHQGKMYVNKETQVNGQSAGGIPVYDINRNRTSDPVTAFVHSASTNPLFKNQVYQPLVKNISSDNYFIGEYWSAISGANMVSNYGDGTINIDGMPSYQSSYGVESPIKRILTERITQLEASYFNLTGGTLITNEPLPLPREVNITASALQNVARKYTTKSDHFIFRSSSVRSRDLVYDSNNINFIFIPSMYYGSTIKKGSVELNYYITGSKIASCADTTNNGTLIGTLGATSGSVVGLVMYDEGVIMLTSSAILGQESLRYNQGNLSESSWLNYGTTLNDSQILFNAGNASVVNSLARASYDLNFKGVNYINSMTMFAHARKGHLNHSNNPTYRDLEFTRVNQTGPGLTFGEGPSDIANIVSGSHVSSSFDKTTYISKVHIYDNQGNLIAITSLAKPIKKTLQDEFTFKMKLDL